MNNAFLFLLVYAKTLQNDDRAICVYRQQPARFLAYFRFLKCIGAVHYYLNDEADTLKQTVLEPLITTLAYNNSVELPAHFYNCNASGNCDKRPILSETLMLNQKTKNSRLLTPTTVVTLTVS
jgi:hypothetical protein